MMTGKLIGAWRLVMMFLLLPEAAAAAVDCAGQTLPRFRTAGEANIPVTVVAEGAIVRGQPAPTGSVKSKAPYLKVYYLIDSAGSGDQLMYLVGTADEWGKPEKCVGWLADEDVLVGSKAIQDRNSIFLKGLVINEWREAARGVEISGAALWNGPARKEPFKKIGEIGLFSFYFIFKEVDRNGTTSYLLGETAVIGQVTQPGRDLVGWVDSKRLMRWATRQAIEFDKGTAARRIPAGVEDGAKIFVTPDEVLADLRGQTELGGKPLEPIAVEDPAVKQWSHLTPRFPLDETRPNSVLPAAGPLYRVGFIGDQILMDGTRGAPPEVLAENLSKASSLLNNLNQVDLIFVIDSTGSMRQYFSAASDAVVEIAKKVKKDFPEGGSGPEIRFSIVFYRDFVDNDGQPNPADTYLTKRLPFTTSTDIVARFLKDEEKMICEGCGGDEPEAMFYGLDYALSAAGKEVDGSKRSFRAVILIGDNGNHAVDPRSLDAARIAQALDTQRCEFFSLQVVGAEDIDRSEGTRAFRDQSREIGRFLDATAKVERFAAREPATVARNIVEAARGMVKDLSDAKELLRVVTRGEIGLVEGGRKYGVRLTRRLTQMMKEAKIDSTIFLEKSVQIFERGWISEREPQSGLPQIKTVLLIDRITLEQLQGVLAGLTRQEPSPKSVIGLWTKALEDVALGEVDIHKPVAQLIESHLGLPIREKLLNRSLEEISNMSPRELSSLHSELLEDLHRVRALSNEEKIELQREPRPDGGFEIKVRKLGSRPVWWTQKGTREYGWIPAEELP
jgi:hypothetical protein